MLKPSQARETVTPGVAEGAALATSRRPPTTGHDRSDRTGKRLSAATVSKVLNGKPDVSPQTRLLVQNALVEFRVPQDGRTVRRRRSSTSCSTTSTARGLPRSSEERRPREAEGLTVAFTALSEGDERRVWFDHITSRGTRGIIFLLSQLTGARGAARARGLPFVVIDPTAEPGPEVSSVGATNWSGGLAATKHLIDLGHRRNRDNYRSSRAAVQPSAPRRLPWCPGEGRPFGGHRVGAPGRLPGQGWLRAGQATVRSEPRPTAIFAGNDLSALGVLRAARQAGLRVPEDLSVVGFDDIPLSEWSTPALTTVRQPLTEMARVAVQILLESAESRGPVKRHVELATDLVVRESTGTARGP